MGDFGLPYLNLTSIKAYKYKHEHKLKHNTTHNSVMYTNRITKPVVNWLVLGSTVSFVYLVYLSLIS